MRTYSQLLLLRLHDCQRSSSNRLHTRIIMKLSNNRRHHRIPLLNIKSGIKKALSFLLRYTIPPPIEKNARPCFSFQQTKSMGVACNNLQTFDICFCNRSIIFFPFLLLYLAVVSPIAFLIDIPKKLFLLISRCIHRASFDNVEYHSHLDVLVSKKLTISKKVGGRFLFRCATPALVGSQYQGSPKVDRITCSKQRQTLAIHLPGP